MTCAVNCGNGSVAGGVSEGRVRGTLHPSADTHGLSPLRWRRDSVRVTESGRDRSRSAGVVKVRPSNRFMSPPRSF